MNVETLFNQLYSNGALLVLWGALLFHLILPFPREAHPAILWHKFAEQLADKVNTNSSYSQSMLSGTLAMLLMTLPMLALLIALKPLVWQAQLFDLALLLLAIDWRNTDKFTNQFVLALAREDKEHAKMLLTPIVNRSTRSLSLMGLGKAGAETLIMSYGRNVVAVLFWYALAGGLGAFLYRMTVELARAWSPSRKRFSPWRSCYSFGCYLRLCSTAPFCSHDRYWWKNSRGLCPSQITSKHMAIARTCMATCFCRSKTTALFRWPCNVRWKQNGSK